MVANRPAEPEWTRERVEHRLIAVFRRMPLCPVYRLGRTVRTPSDDRNELTDVLEWAAILERDPDARAYLWVTLSGDTILLRRALSRDVLGAKYGRARPPPCSRRDRRRVEQTAGDSSAGHI